MSARETGGSIVLRPPLANNDATVEAEARRIALVRDLDRLARGDTTAMARVYAATSPKLYPLLLRMLSDPAEAEEALQDVYLSVWRRAAVFDPTRASPITWLVAIARNRAIDRIRAGKALRRGVVQAGLDGQELSQTFPTQMEGIERVDEDRRLELCVESLDERTRNAVRAAFFGGLTYEQLAARERVPLGTMKSRIRRGLLSLRKCMTDGKDE